MLGMWSEIGYQEVRWNAGRTSSPEPSLTHSLHATELVAKSYWISGKSVSDWAYFGFEFVYFPWEFLEAEFFV